MRIDKFLSEMGVASRKECALMAKKGQVLLNGEPIKDVSRHIDPNTDRVSYLGRLIGYTQFFYVMLNKPEGYVSATEDARLPVVTELLPEEYRKRAPHPVGRLDRDTVGLMLLTNDGALSHTLLSPKRHVKKVYRFTSSLPLADGAEESFLQGLTLADGYECKSAELTLARDRLSGTVVLTEGKYHQIKRMVAAMGGRVEFLERISFGGIPLDTNLERGEWRELRDDEIALLRSLAN